MLTNTLMWVNPDFYSYYFVAPAGETQVEEKAESQNEAKEELRISCNVSISCYWRNVSTEIARYVHDAWQKNN